MTITPEQLDEWKRLAGAAAKAAPGDWDTDTIDNDGGGSGHFDSYCVFIAGKPGEIGKGIVDTLNSDNISVEVDVDEDGIRAWDENGRRVVEYIAAFDPPATLALIAEVERLRAEAEWRDIATAPRDGTKFEGYWPPIRCLDESHVTTWREADLWHTPYDSSDDDTNPTHWRPLTPPSKEPGHE